MTARARCRSSSSWLICRSLQQRQASRATPCVRQPRGEVVVQVLLDERIGLAAGVTQDPLRRRAAASAAAMLVRASTAELGHFLAIGPELFAAWERSQV